MASSCSLILFVENRDIFIEISMQGSDILCIWYMSCQCGQQLNNQLTVWQLWMGAVLGSFKHYNEENLDICSEVNKIIQSPKWLYIFQIISSDCKLLPVAYIAPISIY